MQNTKQSEEKSLCPCCGAKLNGRWEHISKGIAENLIRFREQVLLKKENKVHLMKDLFDEILVDYAVDNLEVLEINNGKK